MVRNLEKINTLKSALPTEVQRTLYWAKTTEERGRIYAQEFPIEGIISLPLMTHAPFLEVQKFKMNIKIDKHQPILSPADSLTLSIIQNLRHSPFKQRLNNNEVTTIAILSNLALHGILESSNPQNLYKKAKQIIYHNDQVDSISSDTLKIDARRTLQILFPTIFPSNANPRDENDFFSNIKEQNKRVFLQTLTNPKSSERWTSRIWLTNFLQLQTLPDTKRMAWNFDPHEVLLSPEFRNALTPGVIIDSTRNPGIFGKQGDVFIHDLMQTHFVWSTKDAIDPFGFRRPIINEICDPGYHEIPISLKNGKESHSLLLNLVSVSALVADGHLIGDNPDLSYAFIRASFEQYTSKYPVLTGSYEEYRYNQMRNRFEQFEQGQHSIKEIQEIALHALHYASRLNLGVYKEYPPVTLAPSEVSKLQKIYNISQHPLAISFLGGPRESSSILWSPLGILDSKEDRKNLIYSYVGRDESFNTITLDRTPNTLEQAVRLVSLYSREGKKASVQLANPRTGIHRVTARVENLNLNESLKLYKACHTDVVDLKNKLEAMQGERKTFSFIIHFGDDGIAKPLVIPDGSHIPTVYNEALQLGFTHLGGVNHETGAGSGKALIFALTELKAKGIPIPDTVFASDIDPASILASQLNLETFHLSGVASSLDITDPSVNIYGWTGINAGQSQDRLDDHVDGRSVGGAGPHGIRFMMDHILKSTGPALVTFQSKVGPWAWRELATIPGRTLLVLQQMSVPPYELGISDRHVLALLDEQEDFTFKNYVYSQKLSDHAKNKIPAHLASEPPSTEYILSLRDAYGKEINIDRTTKGFYDLTKNIVSHQEKLRLGQEVLKISTLGSIENNGTSGDVHWNPVLGKFIPDSIQFEFVDARKKSIKKLTLQKLMMVLKKENIETEQEIMVDEKGSFGVESTRGLCHALSKYSQASMLTLLSVPNEQLEEVVQKLKTPIPGGQLPYEFFLPKID